MKIKVKTEAMRGEKGTMGEAEVKSLEDMGKVASKHKIYWFTFTSEGYVFTGTSHPVGSGKKGLSITQLSMPTAK